MAVHIRLARHGSKKSPFYRVVVADQRSPRDGRFIENLGTFDPTAREPVLDVNRDRLQFWQARGAKPTHTVAQLIKKLPVVEG